MSRLEIKNTGPAQKAADQLFADLQRRLAASPGGLCPVDLALSFVTSCHSQSCGKCVPCRVGLGQLANLLRDVLDGKATLDTIDLIENTAKAILDSADCAIGYETAQAVLKGLEANRAD